MTLTTPLFSIIIPTYNHGHLINKCIDSILAQSYNNWEALIINNFSNDNTIGIVSNYKDSRITITNFNNNGIIAASRNVGIKLAKGEWLCFLDSDDFWYPTKLQETLPFLSTSDLIYHDLNIYKGGKIYKHKKLKITRNIGPDPFIDMLLFRNPIITSSVVVRSELVNVTNNFSENPDIITLEDFDLWLRLTKKNCRFRFIPKALGGYYIGNSNQSRPSLKRLERELAFYSLHLKDLNDELKKRIISNISYAHGRICQLAGEYQLGVKYYRQALHSSRFSIFIKAFIFIVFCEYNLMKNTLKYFKIK